MDEVIDNILAACTCRPVVGPAALGSVVGTFDSVLAGHAAVAAAAVGDVGVTGPDGEEIPIAMTNADVNNYVPGQGLGSTHEALIFMRDYCGESGIPGTPSCRAIELTHTHITVVV